jgi:hypothetical protein
VTARATLTEIVRQWTERNGGAPETPQAVIDAFAAEVHAETIALEQAAVHARSALAALCYDLEDPGSNARGALYLLQQATLRVDAPRDDTTLALARHEAKVMRRCADFVRDTYSGDETADAADTLDRDADIHERGCPSAVGELDNCQRCGFLRDRHPVPVRSGYGLNDATEAVQS